MEQGFPESVVQLQEFVDSPCFMVNGEYFNVVVCVYDCYITFAFSYNIVITDTIPPCEAVFFTQN